MRFSRSVPAALAVALLSSSFSVPPARAADSGPIKIALITDMSGVYAALAGPGAVEAVKMAVDDFGGKVLGRQIIVDVVDHRNQGPVAQAKAREEYDSGAELALDMTNSATAIAVAGVAKDKHKLAIVTGGASSALTGANCNKYTYHYAYDTYALANSTGANITASGGKKWYGIVPDYAFGAQMLTDFTDAVQRKGGEFVHSDKMPLGTTDFSSYMIAAKNAHPDVLGLLNAGADTVNSMKAAKQFQLDKQMKIAVGLLFLSDVDALPDVFAGSRITTSWYWNEDAAARKWADRYAKAMHGLRPTDIQAADYSATTQWLNAVKAAGTTDADAIVKYLDGRQFNDFYAHAGEWRARDHRVTHEMYVVDVLSKDKIKEPHGWFKIVQTIPPSRAFRPESQSTCKKDW
ncbi:branched-chain amino acid ABC transporter substrate-binding protein [Vulcanimicrobium alpinum]|uniref:Branched-chain amino acid ABC transporter substrate-binding protein n=1 Tax=Vulcanimicrobium alpinum TaxID=3016050 RepID=A0AAN2C9H5_UNVUL|nr:ABC transporter substrate-binding protein [Vulcanimicrobium alpinum]BDE06540.1 branched-chain amino acid ABC transporter substrate-binding protein [Vulcanimicrobium alpinum]